MAHRTKSPALLIVALAFTATAQAHAAQGWASRHYASGTFLGQPEWYSRYGEGIVGWWQSTGPEPGDGPLSSASPLVATVVKMALKQAYPERLELQGFVLPAATFGMRVEEGLQLSWLLNVTRGGTAYQVAALHNLSRGDVTGAQVSAGLNRAAGVRGVQVGLVNVAGEVTGMQLGLVNVARSVNGVPVGLVNVVENGERSVEVWGSDTALANVGVRMGSRTFYTMLAAGIDPLGSTTRLLAGLAGGVHLDPGAGFFVDVDQLTYAVKPVDGVRFDVKGSILTKTRLVVGVRVTRRLGLYTGLTANVSISWGGMRPAGGEIAYGAAGGSEVTCRVLPGFLLGARIFLPGIEDVSIS